jgi:hypothetical protein
MKLSAQTTRLLITINAALLVVAVALGFRSGTAFAGHRTEYRLYEFTVTGSTDEIKNGLDGLNQLANEGWRVKGYNTDCRMSCMHYFILER